MKKDYYKILEIDSSANKSEIKAAYRKLAMKYHPDKNKSKKAHDIFINVNEAYAFLSDDKVQKNQVFEHKTTYSSPAQDELKKRMEWARNYAKYKKIKEDNLAAISYKEIQNSTVGWVAPLISWLSIGYAVLIFLDFNVLPPISVEVNYSYEYMNSSNNTMVFFVESVSKTQQKNFGEFAVDIRDVNKLNAASPKIYNCELSPLFKEDIYLTFMSKGEVDRVFNYQSTYTIFYVYFVILLLPIVTIVSKGPNMVYVFFTYVITGIVFFVEIILSISLIV